MHGKLSPSPRDGRFARIRFRGVRADTLEPRAAQARVLRAARAAREPKSESAQRQSSAYAHVVDSDAFVDFGPGIKWAVTRGEGMTLVQFVFQPPECGDIPEELHSLTQSGVVLEGSFSMHYGDGTVQRMRKQDVYMIAPGRFTGRRFTSAPSSSTSIRRTTPSSKISISSSGANETNAGSRASPSRA